MVHGQDGLDELTVVAKSHVAELHDGKVREFELDPFELGLGHPDRSGLAGGDAVTNAARVRAILGGETGAARDVVVLNAGAALLVGGRTRTLEEGIREAQSAIDDGSATRKLEELQNFRG